MSEVEVLKAEIERLKAEIKRHENWREYKFTECPDCSAKLKLLTVGHSNYIYFMRHAP